MENVPQVHGTKNIADYERWLEKLEDLGYKNFWKDLNSKDYGIPQNRNRCFMVSLLKGSYVFPSPKPLKRKLKDFLETSVDERYYIDEELFHKISNWKSQQHPLERVNGRNSIVPTLTARGAGKNHGGMIIYSDDLENTTNLVNKFSNEGG